MQGPTGETQIASASTPFERLTEAQRGLVAQNIGLVRVHLRRFVPNLSAPRRDREWEDLFQEGCLGLMRAAAAFDPQGKIPFAAFALPRIHKAVSEALRRKFTTIYVPPRRAAARRPTTPPDVEGTEVRRRRSKVHPLPHDVRFDPADDRRCDPNGPGLDTVGERLRSKYERAVGSACDAMARSKSARDDRRGGILQRLADERFAVPDEDRRTPLRRIARDLRSAYSRVALYDKQLRETVREVLQADPEFRELRRVARTDAAGPNRLVDQEFEQALAATTVDEFLRRLRAATAAHRAELVDTLLTLSHIPVEALAQSSILKLSSEERERLLRGTNESVGRHHRDSPSAESQDQPKPLIQNEV